MKDFSKKNILSNAAQGPCGSTYCISWHRVLSEVQHLNTSELILDGVTAPPPVFLWHTHSHSDSVEARQRPDTRLMTRWLKSYLCESSCASGGRQRFWRTCSSSAPGSGMASRQCACVSGSSVRNLPKPANMMSHTILLTNNNKKNPML